MFFKINNLEIKRLKILQSSLTQIRFFIIFFIIGFGVNFSQAYGANGDINNDDHVNLADAILALQVVSQLNLSGNYVPGNVNGDSRIGLQEAVYALQWISGLRSGGNSTNAALSGLTFCCGPLSPLFDPEEYKYYTVVDNSVSEITLTATADDPSASITAEGMAIVSGETSNPIHVDVGVSYIDVVVTAADGITSQTYRIQVFRQQVEDASNAYLANLHLSVGDLEPAFHPDQEQYTATVPSDLEQITVTAALQTSGSSLRVNGEVTESGTPSNPIALTEGENDPINVQVTSENTSITKIYQIIVTRGDAQELSVNAFLSGLTLSSAPLNEIFFPALFNYSATVANSVSSVSVTPTADDPNASITVNGTAVASGAASPEIDLLEGANTISIEVRAQDPRVSRVYEMIVIREGPETSSNTQLSSLDLSLVQLNEPFAPGTLNYTANVLNYVEQVVITPVAAGPQAAIRVNGSPVSSGQPSDPVDLSIGENILEVVVTAEDDINAKTYLVHVFRHGAPSAVAALVYVTDAPASPPFEFETLPEALSYLSEHLTAGQLGEVRIQTTRPMAVDELSISANVIITLEPGASNTIIGPETAPLIVNAGGSLDVAGLNLVNAAGIVVNSTVGLSAVNTSFGGDTTINLGGGAGTQSARVPLDSSGSYGFVSKAFQFNNGSVSGGLTVNAGGGAGGEQKDIEITNTQAASASLVGTFSETSYLNLKSNLFSNLDVNIALRNDSKLDVTGHMNLDNVNTVVNMDGNARVNFSSSTMAKLEAKWEGVQASVNFQNTFIGDAAMQVNNSDFNFSAKNANFNYFNAETSYSSSIGTIGFDLNGAFFEKSMTFNFPDLPVEASVNFGLRGITSRGPSEIRASGSVTCNLDDVILGAEAALIYNLGSALLNANNTKFLGKVFIQSKDQNFEFNSSISNADFRDDVFGYFASANLAIHWGGAVEEGHSVTIQGDYEGVYPYNDSRRSPFQTSESEIVFSGLDIEGSSDRPALFIGGVDVPVTIENSTIKSSQASIVCNDVDGAVTIRNNSELVGGVYLNGDPNSEGVMIDKTYTITNNTISHSVPGMSCIHTHAVRDVQIIDNDLSAMGFGGHGVHVNGGKAIIRGGTIITSGPMTSQAIGVGESAGGHNGIVYAEGVEIITGAVQTGPKGYVRLTDNTFSNALIVDYKEGLTAYPRLLNDPVADNSGLNPDEDIVGSLIDWNDDEHNCPDYPTKCDEWDEEEKECGCGEDGVSPPSEPGI